MEIICRPIEGPWPRTPTPDGDRKGRPFQADWNNTVRMLRAELRKIETTVAIVQTAHREKEISVTTGWPSAQVKPSSPGVIIAADTKHGALKWLCDDCDRWMDNVRAIVLTLERLRLADLYGVTRRGEQYLGWKMLPGPITAGNGSMRPMTMDEAARFIGSIVNVDASQLLRSRESWNRAYRYVVKETHPDVRPNDPRWPKVQEASGLLARLHNKK